MSGYLFVHFTGEHKDGEQIYFSLSKDGLFWEDLNRGEPVLVSNIGEKGVRDPFLVRDRKKQKYYLIATDLRMEAGKGWDTAQYHGSRNLIVWEAEDLVNWSEPRTCLLGVEGAGCVWAPEAVYDEEKEKFFVFYASMIALPGEEKPKQRIYGCYTEDFHTFSKPELYIERQCHVIDTTIIHSGDCYYRFSKDETNSKILMERGKTLDGTFEKISSRVLDQLEGVEGPECYLLPDGRTWCLIVDRFKEGKGYLPILSENLDKGEFCIPDETQYDMGRNKKRHGGVLELEDEEYRRLRETFGARNPVLDGLYADPDLAYFDGKYYLYPTTDGFAGWSGTAFSVFSSTDGWKFDEEGQILDLATEQVPWASGCAWAPCIARKNGKYYYYFCGKNKDGVSCIGAAVGDTPVGPFTAQSEPMVTMEMMKENGIAMSQTIDPSIYMEGEDVYLLFGNGQPAIAKLKEDMVHIQQDTLANLEGAYDFREAITVLKRGHLYHFTWSCDDTGSENYHVNYGTSASLYGPIQFEKTVLEKDGETLGTGHHSILQMPGEDRYRIAYHRFATPLKKYPEGKGYHREVCLGDVEFDSAGRMKKLKIL